MITVDLFSRDACHLCDEALDTLERVRKDIPFIIRHVSLEPGSAFFESYTTCIPVVHINGRLAFKTRVNEQKLREKLKRLGP